MSINFLIGGNEKKQVHFSAKTANRHGMIAGATGTGKTVTLQILAENFSRIGVPVFLADVKGDLSGLASKGKMNDKIQSRINTIKIDNYSNHANPALFWDLFAKQGHPVHTTISEMGPLLLSSLLELNEVQTGILYSAFAIADDLGAVLVIAIFYTKEIVWFYVFVCVMLTLCLAIANLLWIRWTLVYAALGLAIWFFVLGSGIHPTVAGVIVSLFIPARGRYDTDRFLQNVDQIMAKFKCEDQSCGYSILLNQEHMHAVHSLELACHDVETPLQRLMHALHPWVAFTILPFFALSNAGLNFHGVNFSEVAAHTVSLGIFFGLVFGKPLGVVLFSYIAVKTGAASLPKDVRWSHILGSAMLGGIGFTMSLFIADLSFSSIHMLSYAKMAILSASVLSAIIGIFFLGIISTIAPVNKAPVN